MTSPTQPNPTQTDKVQNKLTTIHAQKPLFKTTFNSFKSFKPAAFVQLQDQGIEYAAVAQLHCTGETFADLAQLWERGDGGYCTVGLGMVLL